MLQMPFRTTCERGASPANQSHAMAQPLFSSSELHNGFRNQKDYQ
jgi:hypothetical protein